MPRMRVREVSAAHGADLDDLFDDDCPLCRAMRAELEAGNTDSNVRHLIVDLPGF